MNEINVSCYRESVFLKEHRSNFENIRICLWRYFVGFGVSACRYSHGKHHWLQLALKPNLNPSSVKANATKAESVKPRSP